MSQMVSEYMRLESRLAGMAIGAEGADHDEVRLRLEIMMSQIELLQEGDLGKFISKSEQRKTVVATLIRNLHLLDKQVDTMTPEQVRQILPVLSELDGPLTSMAAATLTQDINIVNITHDKIQHPLLYLLGDLHSADRHVYNSRSADAPDRIIIRVDAHVRMENAGQRSAGPRKRSRRCRTADSQYDASP